MFKGQAEGGWPFLDLSLQVRSRGFRAHGQVTGLLVETGDGVIIDRKEVSCGWFPFWRGLSIKNEDLEISTKYDEPKKRKNIILHSG